MNTLKSQNQSKNIQNIQNIPLNHPHAFLPLLLNNTNTNTNTNTSITNISENILVLKSLLILNLVLLDKFHQRSNNSLLLIHLRDLIDKSIDNNNDTNDLLFDKFLISVEFKKILNIFNEIFNNANYYGLIELHSIYNNFIKKLINNKSFDINIVNDFINNSLCCSNSMLILSHFNYIYPTNDQINSFHLDSIKTFYTNSFNKSSTNYNNTSLLNANNLNIVNSENFLNFHINRWKNLNLLDTHIFKISTSTSSTSTSSSL